jgi:hypothetical protein
METAPADLQHLLAVYTGSPSVGCEAVYVGAPIADPRTGHTSWAWIEQIWRFDPNQPGIGQGHTRRFAGFRDLDVPDLDVDLRDHSASETGS